MIILRAEDAFHRAQLYRMLIYILDEPYVSRNTYFKGGSCAAMLGWLNRFSVDLDFDLSHKADKKEIGRKLQKIFRELDFTAARQSRIGLLYVIKYPSTFKRNSLKLSIIDNPYKSNVYDDFFLPDIDRFARCQTRETMFAHKLISLTDRYEKYNTVAGRDLYDIHHFFSRGFTFEDKIIFERTKLKTPDYLIKLKKFIKNKINERTISQDLATLLPPPVYKQVRRTLKAETMSYLENEINKRK